MAATALNKTKRKPRPRHNASNTKLNQFVNRDEIIKICHKRKTAIYEDVKAELLPPPVKLGRMSLWVLAEVQSVVNARIQGRSEDDIKELVRKLVAKRSELEV